MKFFLLIISLFYFVNSRESYLILRNNFLKFSLKLENYRLKQILNNVGNNLQTLHYLSLEKFYNLSYKYYALTHDEKELLEGLMFFL